MSIRAARLRGPQLPRTTEELSEDAEPAPADEVLPRAANADRYLSIISVCAGAAFAVAFPILMTEPGWIGWTLVSVFAFAVLLRTRTFFGAWQRVTLVVAGVSGLVLVTLWLSEQLSPQWRGVLFIGLALIFFAQVCAVLRKFPQRLLPIWGHLANGLDILTALAVLPLLLQLLGVYAWARGLGG